MLSRPLGHLSQARMLRQGVISALVSAAAGDGQGQLSTALRHQNGPGAAQTRDIHMAFDGNRPPLMQGQRAQT